MSAHNAAWTHFHHQADIGVRGTGPSKEAAFQGAALALMAVIADLSTIEPQTCMTFQLESSGDLLLVDWLSELVYAVATRKMLFSRFEVRIDDDFLLGKAWGEPIDVEKHQPAVEVKGVTFTELKVEQIAEGIWIAQCVVDV